MFLQYFKLPKEDMKSGFSDLFLPGIISPPTA